MEKKNTTKNNIDVYSYKNEGVHGFCIGLYLKAGALYEKDEHNGLSHFFEHMVFKSVNNYFENKLSEYLDKSSLDFNGCTYKEFMRFKITGATKNFKKAVSVITKVIKPLNVTKEDVDCERKRIKAEIRESGERNSLHFFSNSVIWKGTSLENTICGKIKNLDRTGKEKLKKFGEELFFQKNFFFYITGNFTDEDLSYFLKSIENETFLSSDNLRNNNASIPESFFNRKENLYIKNDRFTYVRISFDVDTKKYSCAEYDILYDILFKGENSVIYKELSEKTGLIYSFDCSFEQYSNIGNISFVFEIKKSDFYIALEKVVKALNSLKTDAHKNLECVKPRYVDNAFLSLDDCDDFNWDRAYEGYILEIPEKTIEEKILQYENVENSDIVKMSRDIFKRKNLVLAMKTPKKTTDIDKIENILKELDEYETDN